MTDELQTRWREYHAQDSDLPLQCASAGLQTIGRLMKSVLGDQESSDALIRHLYNSGASVGDIDVLDFVCGEGFLGEPEKLRCLPIYRKLSNLETYGMYGLPAERLQLLSDEHEPIPVDLELRKEYLRSFVEDAVAIKFDVPIEMEVLFGEKVNTLMNATSGRAKLDTHHGLLDLIFDKDDENGLQLGEVAALANMNLKSVRNATSTKGNDALLVDEDDRVDPEEAARWLSKRRGFRTSVWHLDDSPERVEPANDNARIGSVVFVPMARDGSTFSPDDQKGDVYRVGAISDPELYRTFDEALQALQHMEVPRWHAPRKRGWTVCTADRWIRVPKEQLVATQNVSTRQRT